MLRNQYNITPKILRSDGGAEFYHSQLTQFLINHGILHQKSCPYTPQQNGLAECKYRHLLDTTRALMFDANLPTSLWDATILTAVYLINRLPSPNTSNISPYQLLHNRSPDYTHLRVFGCACYPFLPPPTRNKLHPRTIQCVFLGYPSNAKGYLCLHPASDRTYLTRHIIFDESHFPYQNQPTSTISPQIKPPAPLTLPLLLTPASIPNQATAPNIPTKPTQPNTSTNSTSSSNNSPTSSAIFYNTVAPTNPSHHMLTRAKTGSLKPKTIFNLTHSTSSPQPPTSLSLKL